MANPKPPTPDPTCPHCGASNWDVYQGRDAHYFGGYSATCAGCWEYSINLTFEEILARALKSEGRE